VIVAAEAIARVHREEWARVVAALARRYGDLDLAEDVAAEVFAVPSSAGPPTAYPRTPAPGSP
jgi:RNA polymerase sigma-70 factor (ECF subfamily)